MADAGEGEDEIQFLRTVSATSWRTSSQGKGRPGSHQPGARRVTAGCGARGAPGMLEGSASPHVCRCACRAGEGQDACLCARVENQGDPVR